MSIFISSEKICQMICLSTRPGQLLFAYHFEINRNSASISHGQRQGLSGRLLRKTTDGSYCPRVKHAASRYVSFFAEVGGAARAIFFNILILLNKLYWHGCCFI